MFTLWLLNVYISCLREPTNSLPRSFLFNFHFLLLIFIYFFSLRSLACKELTYTQDEVVRLALFSSKKYCTNTICTITHSLINARLFVGFFFFYFLFCVQVQPVNNVVIVSGEQRRDSAVHVHVFILPQTPLPSRLPHNIEQSSLRCTVGPCWLSSLNIAVCTCPTQTP